MCYSVETNGMESKRKQISLQIVRNVCRRRFLLCMQSDERKPWSFYCSQATEEIVAVAKGGTGKRERVSGEREEPSTEHLAMVICDLQRRSKKKPMEIMTMEISALQ